MLLWEQDVVWLCITDNFPWQRCCFHIAAYASSKMDISVSTNGAWMCKSAMPCPLIQASQTTALPSGFSIHYFTWIQWSQWTGTLPQPLLNDSSSSEASSGCASCNALTIEFYVAPINCVQWQWFLELLLKSCIYFPLCQKSVFEAVLSGRFSALSFLKWF